MEVGDNETHYSDMWFYYMHDIYNASNLFNVWDVESELLI